MAHLNISLVLLLSALCVLRCKPTVHDPLEEAPDVYRAALGKITRGCCISEPYAGFTEKTDNDYLTGKIDSSRYSQIWDSLFTIRKNQLPKCVMEFSPLVSAFDLQCSMAYELHDEFFYKHFENTRVYRVIDTLTKSTTYNWKDISPTYIDFVKHDSSDRKIPYGKNGAAVIALSSIYFNKAADHAIIFFEVNAGHQRQRGELIFLEKTQGFWKAVGFRPVWST